jgi:hypothetical protein
MAFLPFIAGYKPKDLKTYSCIAHYPPIFTIFADKIYKYFYMSLLVIGTVAFDAIETPFGKTDKIVGGSATFASLGASYFYDDINIVAVVGDDFPQSEIEDLNNHNVDTEGLQIKQGEKSFFWSGRYHNDMNSRDTLITELNVLADFDPYHP